MNQSSSDVTYGLAIQLKDLFWSAEAFDAGPALKAAMDSSGTSQVDYETVTAWLSWLVDSSYQQNIRFLNNQGNLRDGLIRGELDWITCWSNNLRGLKLKLGDRLGVTALPKGRIRTAPPPRVWRSGPWAETPARCSGGKPC